MNDRRMPDALPRQPNDHPERPVRPGSDRPGRVRTEHPRT
jgi:hypothetical protein